jgi:hypothetical protein
MIYKRIRYNSLFYAPNPVFIANDAPGSEGVKE